MGAAARLRRLVSADAPAPDTAGGIAGLRVVEQDASGAAPGAGQVVVRVRAAALNFPDLLQLSNGYQHRQTFPYTPGLEASGVVSRCGPGCSRLRPGDRVITWAQGGAMADEMVVGEELCLRLPDNLSFAEGAAFRMAYETAYHGLVERAGISPRDVVLVNGGTGGMGFSAVQIAKRVFGCTVIATGGSSAKLEVVRRVAGADHVLDYSATPAFANEVKRLTGGKGVSLVFDTVGGAPFGAALRSTAFGARVLVVGFTSGERPRIPANYVLIKCLTVLGCRAGEMAARTPDGHNLILGPRYARLLEWARKGWLVPHISHRFPLSTDGARAAFAAMHGRKVVGRCVLLMSDDDDTTAAAADGSSRL